jgi:hypothetical protein
MSDSIAHLYAPPNNSHVNYLLTHARGLLSQSSESVATAANLHRRSENMNLFLQLCTFIKTSCPMCPLMTTIAGLLKTAIWGSSVLHILTNEKKPDLQAIHDLLEAHASICSVQPLVASKTESLKPLHYIHAEGRKWEKAAHALLKSAASWEKNGGPSEKAAREIKNTFCQVVSLPVKCACEEELRTLHIQAKAKRDQIAARQSRGRKRPSAKTQGGEAKRQRK